ncbi:glycosyltransferase family 2 protein [Subsaximicrobium wynnwilliamsii]|uniref:Glycosyltransferase family 2 protein n=1 Tax=Subsaximicrobium wynnwilliamsii TaxID=291179 RepID=A0A5C6ZE65_9FLAO|nr:glycosyltransferase [Subsaximicrobium wynnwilliamsii]TXD81697.1 glycosyltransferase family 2 protein [Subsaximicrobium wynnwilliamsii]TXD87452.1 glycosyltransferase family 2 protein [Subsaximicrobium wynnwilliamsii]TXE01140.1 glycosyltransferase family 2 protein [Subsaximicrobium wynnwilliamsii]
MELNNNKATLTLEDGVSIVVVSYNGAERLIPTLKHLANQESIGFCVEVILVDNCSTDNTREIAKSFWHELGIPFPLRIVQETQAGTMFARKKGIEVSSYRYLLYCDDDNWLCKHYLSTAYNIISKDPNIAALGGCGYMQYEHNFMPPNWIKDYEKNYGTGPQGREDGDTTFSKGCLYTAGTILDKAWLDKLYAKGFASALEGRIGDTLIAGEDTELTYALKLIGGKLYYSSKMTFQHFMPKKRITWGYLKRLWFSFGYSNYIISPYNEFYQKRKQLNKVHYLIKRIKEIVKLSLIITKHQLSEGQKPVLERRWKLGEIKAMIYSSKKYQKVQKTIQKLQIDS